jgi:hypothetical protein
VGFAARPPAGAPASRRAKVGGLGTRQRPRQHAARAADDSVARTASMRMERSARGRGPEDVALAVHEDDTVLITAMDVIAPAPARTQTHNTFAHVRTHMRTHALPRMRVHSCPRARTPTRACVRRATPTAAWGPTTSLKQTTSTPAMSRWNDVVSTTKPLKSPCSHAHTSTPADTGAHAHMHAYTKVLRARTHRQVGASVACQALATWYAVGCMPCRAPATACAARRANGAATCAPHTCPR